MSEESIEATCQRCGGRNLLCWYADSDVWNRIVGDRFSIICPQCLNDLADEMGIRPTAWRVSMEGDDPEVSKLRVRIHELNESGARELARHARLLDAAKVVGVKLRDDEGCECSNCIAVRSLRAAIAESEAN